MRRIHRRFVSWRFGGFWRTECGEGVGLVNLGDEEARCSFPSPCSKEAEPKRSLTKSVETRFACAVWEP